MNTKEALIESIMICLKTYDYTDARKDVKGKTQRLNAINVI